jgi:hypothetical protein
VHRISSRALAVVVTALSLGACSSRESPPEAGTMRGGVPDMRGETVMLLPTQDIFGVGGDPDAEIAFALQNRSDGIEWVLPAELDRVVGRSPTLEVNVHALAVGVFLQGEVERIGDPLFRDLLQISALTGGQLALIPVQVRYRPPPTPDPDAPSTEASTPAQGAVEIVATLIETRGGHVLWFGILDGDPGAADDPAALASAADRMARVLVP